MNPIEEGTEIQLDFRKLTKVAETGQAVLPVVLQDVDSNEVLFVGYANEQALEETRRTGKAVLWSTSRDELWRKGATSGDELELVDVRVNCEQNSLLYRVRLTAAGACHTEGSDGQKRRSCYYRRMSDDGLGFV